MISKTEEETSVKRLKKDNRNKRNVGGGLSTRSVSMWGANGGGTKVASNFSLLSSEMTLQI